MLALVAPFCSWKNRGLKSTLLKLTQKVAQARDQPHAGRTPGNNPHKTRPWCGPAVGRGFHTRAVRKPPRGVHARDTAEGQKLRVVEEAETTAGEVSRREPRAGVSLGEGVPWVCDLARLEQKLTATQWQRSPNKSEASALWLKGLTLLSTLWSQGIKANGGDINCWRAEMLKVRARVRCDPEVHI